MTADLWSFATTLYAKPGVEAACLIQQDAGADVCLLLCGLWLDSHGTPHDADSQAQLLQIAETWQHEVVEPLRALRQAWRTPAQQDPALADLRLRVKQLELDAEREQLLRLQAHARSWLQKHGSQQRDWLDALAIADSQPSRDSREQLYAASLA